MSFEQPKIEKKDEKTPERKRKIKYHVVGSGGIVEGCGEMPEEAQKRALENVANQPIKKVPEEPENKEKEGK